MEAAARPLPSEETTPPVTRMNLMGRFSDCGICWGLSGSNGMREQGAHALEVLARVDADRVVSGFDRLDPDAVFERAQLFERLGTLHRGLGKRGDAQQARAAVDVKPDVGPGPDPRLALASERNRRARELHVEP